MTVRNLKTRVEVAEILHVSPSAVTKACREHLKGALCGKKIDVNHHTFLEYYDKKFPEVAATGFDPLYEQAVIFCTENNTYTGYALRKKFTIGAKRARKLVTMMETLGVIPEPGEPAPIIEQSEPEPPKLKPRVINGKVKQTQNKKDEALQKLAAGNVVHEIPENIEEFADMTLRQIIHQFGSDAAFLDWLKATKEIESINEKRLKNATTKGDLIHKEIVKRGIIEPVETVFVNLLSDGARALATRVPAKAASGESTIDIENYISDYIGKFIKKAKADINKTLKGVTSV